MNNTKKRLRSSINLKTKYLIVKQIVEEKKSRKDVQNEFGIKSKQTLHQILKQKEKIVERYENLNKKNCKKTSYLSQSNYPQVEKALLLWMSEARSAHLSINGEVIRQKGIELNSQNIFRSVILKQVMDSLLDLRKDIQLNFVKKKGNQVL
mgnify:FL=1